MAAPGLVVTDVQLSAWLAAGVFPLFRVLGLFASAPVLSHRAVPARVRVAVAVALTGAIAPAIPLPEGLSLASAHAWPAIVGEVLAGLAIGFSARLLFAAFELAGEAIGLQMGLSYAGFFDPGGAHGTAVGSLLNVTGLLTFVAMDGPLLLVAATLRSFERLPVGLGPLQAVARLDPVALGGDVFAIALSIALPFVALLLFVQLALGVIARVAPQLNPMAVGFPITVGAGLALLAGGFGAVGPRLVDGVDRMLRALGG